ncbi:serine protease [Hyphomonas sp.]|uniref:S1 family peptidase n=1 Tax=Hyphomonas sp. TaxID=87 RepID=UPI0025C21B1D|nr:serine protease [Hyphomonas sp.]
MRSFDWLIYIAALGLMLAALFALSPNANAPEPAAPADFAAEMGPLLPGPSPLDEMVLVQIGAPQNGVGTAFAVNEKGDWLTARHVVEGCAKVTLEVAPDNYVPVARIRMDDDHDLALLSTGRSPFPVSLALQQPLRIGDEGYAVGFPQGNPGELATRLVARSRLMTRGRREAEAPILAWAEVGRTDGLEGTLGGISGGPIFDASGAVRGVIVAESPRRGRIYTTAPQSVDAFLTKLGVNVKSGPADRFELSGYGASSDNARRRLQVVKVTCEVSE